MGWDHPVFSWENNSRLGEEKNSSNRIKHTKPGRGSWFQPVGPKKLRSERPLLLVCRGDLGRLLVFHAGGAANLEAAGEMGLKAASGTFWGVVHSPQEKPWS